MEHNQLIEKAKAHLARTVARESTPPKPEDFPQVFVRDTALVHFQKERKIGAWVLLDQTTGDFIAGWSSGLQGTQQGSIA